MTSSRSPAALFIIGLQLTALAIPAYAQTEPQKWGGHLEIEGKKGSQRNLAETNIFLPMGQSEDSLFYMDLRGVMDNQSSREGNVGLGIRHMPDEKFLGQDWIVGGYAFADIRRTPNSNIFKQGTLGVEALTEDIDIRANAYLPESGEKDVNGSADALEAKIVGTQLRITGTQAAKERALPGVDAEIGYKLPLFTTTIDSIRLYGGGFTFNAQNYDRVAGPRARMEVSWNDLPLLEEGSRFTLSGEMQHDAVRDTSSFIGARLRIPFESFNPRSKEKHPLSALEKRMTERVQRDVDIVSNSRRPVVDEPAEITINGTTSNNVIVLDADDNVPTEVTNAGTGAFIILDGDAGTINSGATSITPLANQTITGGGIEVTGTTSGYSAIFGSRPTVTANAGVNIFDLAGNDDITLSNMDLTGGLRGIYNNGGATSNLVLSDLNITGTASNGINLASVASSLTLSDLSLSNTTATAITINTGNLSTYSDITITNSGSSGFETFNTTANSEFSNITITNSTGAGLRLANTSNFNTFENITVDTTGVNTDGFYISGGFNTLNNIDISNTGRYGLFYNTGSNNTITNVTIDNSSAIGAYTFVNSSTITGITSLNASAEGVYIVGNINTISDLDIQDSVSNGFTYSGANSTISGVTVTDAGLDSVNIDSSFNTNISDIHTIRGANYGIYLNSNQNLVLDNFSISDSLSYGLVTVFGINDQISNGTISNSGGSGFASISTDQQTFEDIVIQNSAGHGIEIFGNTNMTINNVSVSDSALASFSFDMTDLQGGTGNTSTNPATVDCFNVAGNTGSILVNGVACP